MFLDKVKISITSGSGGNGVIAWRREKYVDKGGPAGGDGGRGGDIILVAEKGMSTLIDFKYKKIFKAPNGESGRSKNQHGKNAEDIYIKVPCGTIVKDVTSGKVIGDLVKDKQELMVAQGGRGGRGNARFANSIRKAPHFCEPGESGIERELELELKLLADVGLLGQPNAGKSTLISVISAAKPKIADYPFTTLVPNLGIVKKPDGDGVVFADIPGLIEGASKGVGLGHEFLRHVERTRLLVHLLDSLADDPVKNFEVINNELNSYGGRLTEIPQVVALNKIDSVDPIKLQMLREVFEDKGYKVFCISAATSEGTKELVDYLITQLEQIPLPEFDFKIEADEQAYDHDDSAYTIHNFGNVYEVVGGKIERLVSVTDLSNTEAIFRLQNILKSMGVFKDLENAGIKDEDVVRILDFEFIYYSDESRGDNDEG